MVVVVVGGGEWSRLLLCAMVSLRISADAFLVVVVIVVISQRGRYVCVSFVFWFGASGRMMYYRLIRIHS